MDFSAECGRRTVQPPAEQATTMPPLLSPMGGDVVLPPIPLEWTPPKPGLPPPKPNRPLTIVSQAQQPLGSFAR